MKNVWVGCNHCVDASWKLKATTSSSDPQTIGLFDLASNPEEDERLNFRFLECRDSQAEVEGDSSQGTAPIREVISALKTDANQGNLKGWLLCTEQDCDNEVY